MRAPRALLCLATLLALALGAGRAAAAALPEPAPGLGKAVTRFVDVKGEPTEQRLASFAGFLTSLRFGVNTCQSEPDSRPGFEEAMRQTAAAQIGDVLVVERGELGLYRAAKQLPSRRDRARFDAALDQVGRALDRQLHLARADRKIADEIHSDCGHLAEGPALAAKWQAATSNAERALARLKLAYGAG